MGVFAAGQSYLLGPLVAFLTVGVLALVLRWAYGTSRTALPPAPGDGDFGLLREVATVADQAEANALRAVLSDAGIRSTSGPAEHGRIRVMVFSSDLDHARRLAGPH